MSGYTRYTVMAWIYDRRCLGNCRLTTYDTDDYNDALRWISKIKKAFGDGVKLIDRVNGESSVLLRDDQMI